MTHGGLHIGGDDPSPRIRPPSKKRLSSLKVKVVERVDSREVSETIDRTSVIRVFDLTETSDEGVAKASLLEKAGPAYRGLPLSRITLEPIWVDEIKDEGHWSCRAEYLSLEFISSGNSPIFSFDTTGGSQHITQSRQTVGRFAVDGRTAPNFEGAIQVGPDRVEGADIVSPVYTWSENHVLADSFVTPGYRGTLFSLTGRMNSGLFKGFQRGECLFLGASGSRRGLGNWEIGFRFAGSPNVAEVRIGKIEVFPKLGWDFVWVQYADQVDEGANSMVKIPVSAHVERVYLFGEFRNLGIGV